MKLRSSGNAPCSTRWPSSAKRCTARRQLSAICRSSGVGVQVFDVEHAQRAGWSRLRGRPGGGQRRAVGRRRPAQRLEQQPRVGHGARHRADDVEVQQQARQRVLARPGAERGLQADQAGVRGRAADRAAAVLRDGQRPDAGGHRRDRAAAGAARRQRRVPGVAGGAEQRVRGVAVVGELGHVGLADRSARRRRVARPAASSSCAGR